MKSVRLWIIFIALFEMQIASQAYDGKFFYKSVEPILLQHCYECHSHATGAMEGDLTLDWRSGWKTGGSRGTAIVPGDPEGSLLIKAIKHIDPDLQMPEEKLSEAEINILSEWVKRGANDPRTVKPATPKKAKSEWWSLQPLKRPTIPGNENSSPIDSFIHSRIRSEGLQPSPKADRRTLIRRLTYDLHGVSPTVEETEAFIADEHPDAWKRLIDRLLESPRYGERWARHWLDTVHFADSHGFEHDVFRPHAWRYRDYVIKSFNQDKPWSQFVKEQLAADYFYPESPELTAALGFLGAGPYDQSTAATAPKSFAYLDRDDLVTQVMGSFVSTTANCARCHAHKFDPITQEDYFALQAVFSGIVKGDVSFDRDKATAKKRVHWKNIIEASQNFNAEVLLTSDNLALLTKWEKSRQGQLKWESLKPDVFISSDVAKLKRLPDNSILSGGKRPDQDTVVITVTPELKTISAVRLDVLQDDTLPIKGPGRMDNGNFHLSEIELRLFSPEQPEGQLVPIRRATADFNQSEWTIQNAIDGNTKTAWGIFPLIGVSHNAVFELEKLIDFKSGMRLVVTLKQLYGGGHVIGRFKVSVTDTSGMSTIALSEEAETALKLPAEKRSQKQKLILLAAVMKYEAENKLKNMPKFVKVYGAASEAMSGLGKIKIDKPAEIRLLTRGDINKPRGVVDPGGLSALTELKSRFELSESHQESARRAALAGWLVDRKNVLTWRSIVNRVWHYHFGKGLCDTPNDFGEMGGTPSHPELLDWLACELQNKGGSIKHLHRLICNSETYQQSSANRPELIKKDPENRLLARMSRQRLDAGSFRDSVLLLSGRIDWEMGGPGIAHFTQKPGAQLTPILNYNNYDLDSPGATRRSIYRVVWRGIPDPLMEALDFPDLGLLSPSRGFSASPLQSLVLFNNRFVLHHAQLMAKRAEAKGPDLSEQIKQVILWAWLRQPTENELIKLTELAEKHDLETICRLVLNSNEFLFID